MDGEGEKGTQNANVHRNMLPRASQRGVPFDRETRLRAKRPSVAVIDARKRWPARRRSDHTNRGIARDLVTLLEGTQARMG